MIKKQTRTIIICVAAFAVVLVAFLIIKPILRISSPEEKPPELLPGEVLGANNRILMFPQAQKADILSIEVHNEHGTYTFYRGYEGDNDNFYIKGMEGAPYSREMLSSLIVSSGYTLSMKRLEDPEEDFSAYGLGEKDSPAWYLLTLMDGTQHKVFIGNKILAGGGYYCMYEGRKAVYVLDTSLSATLLADIKTLIMPLLGYTVNQTNMLTIDDFQIIKNDELFVWIDTLSPEEANKENGMIDFKLKCPEGYKYNQSTYSMILERLSSFAGDETVLCGSEVADLDKDMLKEKYGIDIEHPYYMLHYKCKNADQLKAGIPAEKCEDMETFVTFSKPDENGDMYAYSILYNMVAKINVAHASFINWGLLNFVSPDVFMENIDGVKKISVEGTINNGEEKLNVNAYFTLDGEKQTIVIKQNGSDKAYNADEVKNFRQFYKVLIGIKLQDYADTTDISKMNADTNAKLTVELDNGEKLEYEFYSYSSRRCFYTVNGKGEFYVLRDSIEKMLRDTDRLINGLPIDSEDNN